MQAVLRDYGHIRRTSVVAATVALTLANASIAQEAEENIQEIVVTGSRIARSDYLTDSPLATVGGEQFQLVAPGTPEYLLNTMPQVSPDIGASSTDRPGFGRATINLRGLGAQRNLVLINGRRMVGSDSAGIVDVNTIPTTLIERVEIITGGASAVYGADAVAGVVNFILKDDHEGVAADVSYGASEHGDAEEYNAALSVGGAFADGRGNAVFTYNYFERKPLFMSDRGFSRPSEYPVSTPWNAYNPAANPPSQEAIDQVFGTYGVAGGGALRTDQLAFNDDGTLFSMSISDTAPPVANFRGSLDDPTIATHYYPNRFSYQYSPHTGLIMPMERSTLFGNVTYDITERVEAYTQMLFTRYDSRQVQGAAGAVSTLNGGSVLVPVTNPFIPDDLRTLLASRTNPNDVARIATRFPELGTRNEIYVNDVHQVLAGLQGRLANDWRWDVYAATGRVDNTTKRENGASWAAVQRLVNATDGGASLCAGGFDIFGRNRLSTECVDFIRTTAIVQTQVDSQIYEASLSGDLFDWYAGPVGFAIGAQHRADSFDFAPDGTTISGDISGFPAQNPVHGSVHNTDVFAELRVPVFLGDGVIQSASLTSGYRRSDHSTAGSFDSFKIEGDIRFGEPLRLRASYQRAVRAPNIGELFAPQNYALPTVNDPCNANSAQRTGPDAARVRDLCIAQGVPVAIVDSYQQSAPTIMAVTGGNRNLDEETADSYTVGAILSSTSDGLFSDLSLSLDYYDIKLDDAIATLLAADFVPRCFNAAGGNPNYDASNVYCRLFERQADGRIENAQQYFLNIASMNVSGVDAQVDWRFDLPASLGTMGFNLVMSWVEKFETQASPADNINDYAGTIGQVMGQTMPEWKGVLTSSWSRGDFSAQVRTRYLSAMTNRLKVVNPSALATDVPETWYFDLALGWRVGESVNLRAGINNVLDQQPRKYRPQQQANTDPSTYDVIGRRFVLGATVGF